jgi:O-antigen/teichoic acid export membrane protein
MKEPGLAKKITGNIVWNFIGQGWLLILTFVTMPFIIHRLDVHLYGIFVLISVVIDYFAFLQFGMGTASIKYIAQYIGQNDDVKTRKTFWTGVISHFFLGLLGTLTLFAFAPVFVDRFFNVPSNLKETALFSLRVGSIGFLLSMLSGMTSGVIRALGRFDILNLMGIIFATLQTAATVILLLMGWSLKEIVIANVIVQFVGLYGYWVYARRLLPFLTKPAWDTEMLFHLLKFGGFVTISAVVGPILTNIEKIFLTSLRSVSALTYYSVPFSLISRLSVIPSSFAQVLFPVFSFYQESDKRHINRELHYRSTLYLLLLYIPPLLFFVFYGGPFLSWWLDKEFAVKSTIVLIILGIAGFINAAAYPSIAVLQGMEKPHLPAAFHVIEMILYIPACYFLIKAFGGVGAAVAWLLRVFLDTLLLHHASCRLLETPLVQWYRKLFFSGFPAIALLSISFWGLKSLNLNFFHPFNIAGVLAIISIYFYVVWRWVLDDPTRGRFRELVKRN